MTTAAAAPPLAGEWRFLSEEIEKAVFTYLPIGDLCALSKAGKSLHKSISKVQARELAYVRVLTAYQSPACVQRPALSELDGRIRGLEERLRQTREAPDEHRDPVAEEIAIERGLNTLQVSRLPHDHFPRRVIDLVMDYCQHGLTQRTPSTAHAIDTRQWNILIGQVSNKPLLPGTEDFLSQPCSIFHGKTRDETHVCIDIPPTVDGQPLTLNRILHFAEHNRGNRIHLNIYWDRILQELGDISIPAGQFFLLKTCLPGTKNKTYQEQLEVLREHPEYMEATLPQVLVASLMEHIRSGGAKTRLFEEEYARTSTTVNNWRLVFGGFGSGWPRVDYSGAVIARDSIGLAVVLRPGGSSPVLGP